MTKLFEYVIDFSPENAWEKTLQFWNLRKGRVRYHIRVNTIFIDRGMSISGLRACSYGEKYQMKFYTLENDPDKTQIKISVRLKFGTGAQWKIASDLLKEWAIFIGTSPQEFGQKWFKATRIMFWIALAILVTVILVFSLSY